MKRAHETLPLKDLVETLQTLCNERRTGTMFVHSDTNHSARIGMEQGRILFIAFGRNRGMDAVEQIKKMLYGKYSFTGSVYNSGAVIHLPPTSELLSQLALAAVGDPIGTNGAAETVPARVGASAPARAADAGPIPGQALTAFANRPFPGSPEAVGSDDTPLAVTGERLFDLVAESLALSIGPVAPIVCSDYRDRLETLSSPGEYRPLIMEIALDMGAPDESARFVARALARAGLRV